MPRRPARWTDKLPKAAVRAAFEEAVVDAYDDEEQHVGLLTLLGDELKFPFPAMVIGEEVRVTSMQWPEDDGFGLDFVCERGGKRHVIDTRSVKLLPPFPNGHLYLAAYLD